MGAAAGMIVTKSIAGRPMRVIDPAAYPYGQNHFDEEEPIWRRWIDAIIPGDIAVDVGAAWGVYTLGALAGGARVLAFEPADSYATLCANVSLNSGFAGGSQKEKRCYCVKQALFAPGKKLPAKLAAEVFGKHYPASQAVEVTTLDGYIAACDWAVGRVCAVKIDVEGAELGVLQGAVDTIRRCRPILLVEDHDGVAPGRSCEVSDYPESIDSRRKILDLMILLNYDVEMRPWDISRNYLVCKPRGGASK